MEIDLEELKVVLPGDPVDTSKERSSKLKFGPGLAQTQDSIICTKAGILNHSKNKWWVENNQRRYVPVEKESVIGTITFKGGEYYRADIGSAHKAMLPNLAFKNVNKKNRPILNIGSLVYARISLANKDMEPELSCIPEENEPEYGELEGGFVIKCTLRYCRRLIENLENQPVLKFLGQKCPFEIAVGMNGKIWIKSDSIKDTIFCCNVVKRAEILNCGDINEKEFNKLVKSLDI